MKIYTIEQKMSGTGNIHDLASEHFDRDIRFAKGCKFAVVLAAYYGGKGYTTHKTEEAAAAKSAQLAKMGYSHDVIDPAGQKYTAYYGQSLVAM